MLNLLYSATEVGAATAQAAAHAAVGKAKAAEIAANERAATISAQAEIAVNATEGETGDESNAKHSEPTTSNDSGWQ